MADERKRDDEQQHEPGQFDVSGRMTPETPDQRVQQRQERESRASAGQGQGERRHVDRISPHQEQELIAPESATGQMAEQDELLQTGQIDRQGMPRSTGATPVEEGHGGREWRRQRDTAEMSPDDVEDFPEGSPPDVGKKRPSS